MFAGRPLPTGGYRHESITLDLCYRSISHFTDRLSLVVVHFYRLVKSREDHTGMPQEEKSTGKKWGYLLLWSLFYCAIGGMIMVQYDRGMADREWGDILFVLVPVVFMVIGSAMGRKAVKRRRFATAVTTVRRGRQRTAGQQPGQNVCPHI